MYTDHGLLKYVLVKAKLNRESLVQMKGEIREMSGRKYRIDEGRNARNEQEKVSYR